MNKNMIYLAGLITLLAWPTAVRAQDLTVEEIVARANLAAYYAGNDGYADVTMTIKDSQGRERVRVFPQAHRCRENGLYGLETNRRR
jgi:hypothetical protein